MGVDFKKPHELLGIWSSPCYNHPMVSGSRMAPKLSERVLEDSRNSVCDNTEATIRILNSLQERALESIIIMIWVLGSLYIRCLWNFSIYVFFKMDHRIIIKILQMSDISNL